MHRVDRSNDAANVLTESLQISPDNPLTHFTLANVLAAMKDFQRYAFSSAAGNLWFHLLFASAGLISTLARASATTRWTTISADPV